MSSQLIAGSILFSTQAASRSAKGTSTKLERNLNRGFLGGERIRGGCRACLLMFGSFAISEAPESLPISRSSVPVAVTLFVVVACVLLVCLVIGVRILCSPLLSAGPSEGVKKKNDDQDAYEIVSSRSPSPTQGNDAWKIIAVIQLRTANKCGEKYDY